MDTALLLMLALIVMIICDAPPGALVGWSLVVIGLFVAGFF